MVQSGIRKSVQQCDFVVDAGLSVLDLHALPHTFLFIRNFCVVRHRLLLSRPVGDKGWAQSIACECELPVGRFWSDCMARGERLSIAG